MKNLVVLITFLGLSTFFSFNEHEFHTSMTKIEYNSGSSEIKISLKLYAEPFESAIGSKVSDGNFKSKAADYIKSNIKVKVNGSPVSLSYNDESQSGEILWIYYSVPNIKDVQSIEISNTLLFGTYSDQTNIINFFVNNKRDYFTAKKGNDTVLKNF